jgi:RNA polymerase sigma-70 factor (ECF subfamily)
MANPVGYLYRVGESRGRRLALRWRRLEVLAADPLTSDGVVDVDLQRALLRLRPDKRVAVLLVDAHGHSYREAAEILGVPVTTVTNHVHRGRQRLRRILERSS